MTRDNIVDKLKHTFAWDLLGESGSPEEGKLELIEVLIAIYNKGIEASTAKVVGCPAGYDQNVVENINDLKIKP